MLNHNNSYLKAIHLLQLSLLIISGYQYERKVESYSLMTPPILTLCYLTVNKFKPGFRINHSTKTALVKGTNDLLPASDSALIFLLVLLDLIEAFESIPLITTF